MARHSVRTADLTIAELQTKGSLPQPCRKGLGGCAHARYGGIVGGDVKLFEQIEPEWGRDPQEWADVVRTSLNKLVHGDIDQMSCLDLKKK